jgi:hypothetical protein
MFDFIDSIRQLEDEKANALRAYHHIVAEAEKRITTIRAQRGTKIKGPDMNDPNWVYVDAGRNQLPTHNQ